MTRQSGGEIDPGEAPERKQDARDPKTAGAAKEKSEPPTPIDVDLAHDRAS